LEEIGIDRRRLRTVWMEASEGEKMAEEVKDFAEELISLGPFGSEFSDG